MAMRDKTAAQRAYLQVGLGWLALLGLALPKVAWSATAAILREIPDEYESTSGHGIALNNAGYAANDGFSAVRANPSLIAASKAYTVNGGYHWPVSGRDYYQVGFVDSKTANWAMGVTYTGFTEDYGRTAGGPRSMVGSMAIDSPLIRRGQLAVAQSIGNLLLGAGATYIEAHALRGSEAERRGDLVVRGAGVNAGFTWVLAPGLTAGGAVENASNLKIADYAPRTYRAGVAYDLGSTVTFYVDGRQRERVAVFEADPVDLDHAVLDSGIMSAPERLIVGSFSAKIQEYLRVIGSYGKSITDERRCLAGGAALVNKNFSLSYTASRPYMSREAAHQAVTVSVDMAI